MEDEQQQSREPPSATQKGDWVAMLDRLLKRKVFWLVWVPLALCVVGIVSSIDFRGSFANDSLIDWLKAIPLMFVGTMTFGVLIFLEQPNRIAGMLLGIPESVRMYQSNETYDMLAGTLFLAGLFFALSYGARRLSVRNYRILSILLLVVLLVLAVSCGIDTQNMSW